MVPRSAEVNRFHFVVVSSLRAQQLLAGSTPRVEEGEHNAVTIAQMEVAEGRVVSAEAAAAVTPAQCHWQL